MSNQYTCTECEKTFTTAWSDEEAHAERKENFPEVPMEMMAVVCDECYKRIMGEHENMELLG